MPITTTRKDVLVLICTSGHTTEVQAWAPKVPSVCAFAPCSERFMLPHELARLTRIAKAEAEAHAAATVRSIVPEFDEDGWVIGFTPAPECENQF